MDNKVIIENINNLNSLKKVKEQDLEKLVEQYPYFTTARILLAKKRHQSKDLQANSTIQKTAVYAHDRTRLYEVIHNEENLKKPEDSSKQSVDNIKKKEDNAKKVNEKEKITSKKSITPETSKNQTEGVSLSENKDKRVKSSQQLENKSKEIPTISKESSNAAKSSIKSDIKKDATIPVEKSNSTKSTTELESRSKKLDDTTKKAVTKKKVDEKKKATSKEQPKKKKETSTNKSEAVKTVKKTEEVKTVKKKESNPKKKATQKKNISPETSKNKDKPTKGASLSGDEDKQIKKTTKSDNNQSFGSWMKLLGADNAQKVPAQQSIDADSLSVKGNVSAETSEKKGKNKQINKNEPPQSIEDVMEPNTDFFIEDGQMQELDSLSDFVKNQIDRKKEPKTIEEIDSLKEAKASNELSKEAITETLAQLFITQQKYDKAIWAYEELSLKYPEKSRFFADKIKAIKKNK